MKLHTLAVLTIFTLSACGGSSDDSTPTTTITSNWTPPSVSPYQLEDTTQLLANTENNLSNLSIEDFFQQSFLMLANRGLQDEYSEGYIDGNNLQLDNVSDEYNTQTTELTKLILEKLNTYDREHLTFPNKVSYDIYKTSLEIEVERANYANFYFPLNLMTGLQDSTEFYFSDLIPVTNKSQAENYINLLNQIERRFDQINKILDTREAAGIIEPKDTLSFTINRIKSFANGNGTSNPYYQWFNQKLTQLTNVTATEKENLRDNLILVIDQKVVPSYQTLVEKAEQLLAKAPQNIGFGQFENGQNYYQFELKRHTTLNLTADEVHQLGLEELERVHTEMRKLFDELGYPEEESLAQLYGRVDNDGGIISANEAKSFYENIIQEAYALLPDAFNTIPTTPVTVIGGDSGGYYVGASNDGVRPAAFYATITRDLPYAKMPSLTYHESVPGHHLQIAIAQEANLPNVRNYSRFTAYVEGWALYAESLVKELNWYEGDIYGELGQLYWEAIRAARLVLDTGIHAKGWTFSEAEQFSLESFGDKGTFSVARYSVMPGQATAYKIGELKFIELKSKTQQALGSEFDLKDFHDAVLLNGSMPLSVLETLVDEYITSKQNQ